MVLPGVGAQTRAIKIARVGTCVDTVGPIAIIVGSLILYSKNMMGL